MSKNVTLSPVSTSICPTFSFLLCLFFPGAWKLPLSPYSSGQRLFSSILRVNGLARPVFYEDYVTSLISTQTYHCCHEFAKAIYNKGAILGLFGPENCSERMERGVGKLRFLPPPGAPPGPPRGPPPGAPPGDPPLGGVPRAGVCPGVGHPAGTASRPFG